MRKSFIDSINQNISPISSSLMRMSSPKRNTEDYSMNRSSEIKRLPLVEAHRTIQESCPEINRKCNRNIIACLKAAQIAWDEYLNTPTKTGQLASKYLKKFKTIDRRFQEQLNQLLTKGIGSAAKIKELKKIFEDVINQL